MSRISNDLKEKIRREAKNRCGYCLTAQEIYPLPLEIEHILPQASGGGDEEENLWLACRVCNGFKHAKIEAAVSGSEQKITLFNPRRQIWSEHFTFSEDQTKIIGITDCGRATVKALKLNNDLSVAIRKRWVSVGWFPPIDWKES
jgi:hypothetical protein